VTAMVSQRRRRRAWPLVRCPHKLLADRGEWVTAVGVVGSAGPERFCTKGAGCAATVDWKSTLRAFGDRPATRRRSVQHHVSLEQSHAVYLASASAVTEKRAIVRLASSGVRATGNRDVAASTDPPLSVSSWTLPVHGVTSTGEIRLATCCFQLLEPLARAESSPTEAWVRLAGWSHWTGRERCVR